MPILPGDVRPLGSCDNGNRPSTAPSRRVGLARINGLVLTSALGVIASVAGATALVGCTADVGGSDSTPGSAGNGGGGSGLGPGGNSGPTPGPGTGGGVVPGPGTGGAGVIPGPGTGGAPVGSGSGGATANACSSTTVKPGRAPLRRLTHFEYNNTIRDLLGDLTSAGNALPSETLADGSAVFGNNADSQSVSSLLVEKYETVAQLVAGRATATPAELAKLAACGSTITATTATATEDACARAIITAFAPRAYRRALTAAETTELVDLYKAIRPGHTFASGIAGVIEAVLQSPDFLYRLEFGVADPTRPAVKRPTGHEMAARLSYLFWGSVPDAVLTTAATSGALLTNEGVLTQAKRMLDDRRSHPIVAYFFDNLLPIGSLTHLERDKVHYPTFNATIGSLMHQETQRFLEYEIYEGPGTWTNILTAPYTFLNEPLAKYYGVAGVTGTAFQKVNTDPTKRIGLLSQGGVMAGSTISNETSPVLRGSFIVQKLMCRIIPLPGKELADQVLPPDPFSAPTARERFAKHSADPICATCHQFMDPIGLTLENFDAVGLWRDRETNVTINASGSVPGTTGTVSGPTELMQKLAGAEATQSCFATQWLQYAYGRQMAADDDCTQQTVQAAFKSSGYNVKQMLLALTQADAFLYLPPAQ